MNKPEWLECDLDDVALALSFEKLLEVLVEGSTLIFERADGSRFRLRALDQDRPDTDQPGVTLLCECTI